MEADSLSQALSDIQQLGAITERQFHTDDVTYEYYDTQSRLEQYEKQKTRLLDFYQKAESIELSGQNLTVNTVKELKDFSGRIYMVVECAPTGYMIYSTETGVFVESSPTSYSP